MEFTRDLHHGRGTPARPAGVQDVAASRRGARARAALAVLLACVGCDGDAPAPLREAAAPAHRPVPVRTYTFPTRARLQATFVAADGRRTVVGSYPGEAGAVVRFVPPAAGEWRYTVRTVPGGRTMAAGSFLVRTAARGYVRRSGARLALDDGSPFRPLGENRINVYDPDWNWNGLAIEEYVAHMARHGMNVLRVFVVSDVEDEEEGGVNEGVLEPRVGVFDARVAAQFDTIFRAAESHGVKVVLVAFALGFSPDDPWKSWQDNTYARERGGPAATRYDFFESPAIRELAAGRLRYLAARWAGSPSLLAIDLLNEPEWDGAIPEVSWTAWAREMTRAWDAADPYGHLVTVGSVGLHWNVEGDEREWWSSPACDVVQWHLYGKEVYDVHALAREMTRKVEETRVHGKPILVGEFAWGGEPKPAYDHTHVGLWSATFAGAGVLAHSAPPFNEDSDEFMTPERARHFRVLREFLHGLPALAPVPVRAHGAAGWALAGPDAGAAWLLAPRQGYGEPVTGARLEVRLPAPASAADAWHVEWVDDVDGRVRGRAELHATGDALLLDAPAFRRHLAVRWTRRR